MKQWSSPAVLGIWAVLSVLGSWYALRQGQGGRALGATLTAIGFLLLVQLIFAARGVAEGLVARWGRGSGVLLGATTYLLYLVYLWGTETFTLARAGSLAGLIFVPLAVARMAEEAPPGTWQDFSILAGIWVFVKFGPSHWLWPYPGGRLAYVLTVMTAVSTAIATFLLQRRWKGVGYCLAWGKSWGIYVLGSYSLFACLAIPLGISLRFIAFAAPGNRLGSFPGTSVAILLFTAWPEELLFRGLLQNAIARATKNDLLAWGGASVLFGFSHITNLGFPNWRYVILATLAGFFYGWTWRKTGSIFASALVHAAVDVTWHFFFRTVL